MAKKNKKLQLTIFYTIITIKADENCVISENNKYEIHFVGLIFTCVYEKVSGQ
jgi:hypothetical protein